MKSENKARLGASAVTGMAKAVIPDKNMPVEEQLEIMHARLELMTQAFVDARHELDVAKKKISILTSSNESTGKIKKGIIPKGTMLIGTSRGVNYLCIVNENNKCKVGNTEYTSLSAAAEGVSGVRRSGWVFWRTPEGKTAKEVYKDK